MLKKFGPYPKLEKITHHRYRSYLPTSFDDELTILQKINKMVEFMNNSIDHTNNFTELVEKLLNEYGDFINNNIGSMWGSINELIDDWENVKEWLIGEGLKVEIVNKLTEWLNDGTLADIINNEVFNMKANKDYVDDINKIVQENKNILDSQEINVKFPRNGLTGATGDGIANDHKRIQDIINFVGVKGGTVFFPDGDYKINSPLDVPSNVILEGNGYNSVISKTNGNYFIRLEGEFDNELKIAENLTSGARTIKTSGNHNLNVGDIVMLKSQRNALSIADSGDEWQLGGATVGTSTAYFGEFSNVYRVDNNNTFVIGNGLIYPSYNNTNIGETDINARASATVQKMKPIKNVEIKNLRFKGDVVGGVRIFRCYNVVTKNLIFEIERNATTIFIEESFMCHDENSKTYFNPNNVPSDHYMRNAYKSTSSHSCGFIGSYCENGTQPFDFNFRDKSIVCTFPYATGVETKFSTMNGLTSHGGTYGMSVTNSRFTNCVNYGISSRCRNSLITNNVIQGGINPNYSYGVAIYEGSATDCIVNSNQISGFNKGVTVIDGTTREKLFKWIGLQITNNSFKDVNRCILFDMNNSNNYTGNVGVNINNNTVAYFNGEYAKFVTINKVNGVNISDNVVNNPHRNANAGVYIDNATNIIMSNNLFNNIGNHLWVVDVDDGKTLSIKYDSQYTYSQSNINIPDTGVSLSSYISGSINPRIDGTYALGWSGGRWSTVWATNGTISTSDENMKDDISSVPIEWVKAWGDVEFKRYKMKEAIKIKGGDARWHIGVVAQDIYNTFMKHGIDATEIGLLCVDKWEEEGEKIERWSIRSDECMFLESEYQRKLLKGEIT